MTGDTPSIIGAGTFAAKVLALRARRGFRNLLSPTPRHGKPSESGSQRLQVQIAEVRTPLWTAESLVERSLQLGKIQNLRVAVSLLSGIAISGGRVFSFWRQVGRASRRKGFVEGRELREGCMIPAVGGGLCQLSNALYEAALESGCEILERHAHSMVVPGSAAAAGKDATVAWNYIDLRFRPAQDIRLEAGLTATELVVRFLGQSPTPQRQVVTPPIELKVLRNPIEHTCTDCEAQSCFRHRAPEAASSREPLTAYLLDEAWPEFVRYTAAHGSANDAIALPMTRGRYSEARSELRHRRVITATLSAVRRGMAMRWAGTVPERVRRQLSGSEQIARSYSKYLPYQTNHLVVAQSLLPYLWRAGALGGRTFDVFMTRSSLNDLHRTLDEMASRWPDRRTLKEYRAPEWIVSAESEALSHATKIITPHRWLAQHYLGESLTLDWQLPACDVARRGMTVIYPGPTVARKGAFDLREALRGTGIELCVLGSELEGPNFWAGIKVQPAHSRDWMDGAAVVVQPALLEDNPRPLLRAIAAGIPVICTAQCGVSGMPGVEVVEFGEPLSLKHAIKDALSRISQKT
jgi:hypothetical protein